MDPIPALPHLRLRCTLTARRRAFLPPYKGSTLRGAFGRALRRMVCVMGPGQPCGGCPLRLSCHYARLFEPFAAGEVPAVLGGVGDAPRPYVIEPRAMARRFDEGDELEFDLLLFGRAVELQGLAVVAVERMAGDGLGAGRHPFRLARVAVPDGAGGWQVGWEAGARRWPAAGVAAAMPAVDEMARRLAGGRAVIRLATPTRLKASSRLLRHVEFSSLGIKALYRLLGLAHFHGAGAVDGEALAPLVAAVEGVTVVGRRLRWRDWARYSNRQKTKILMGGWVGEMEVAGDLEPLAPLLAAAEVAHVGKGTTLGLGKLEVGAA